MNTAQQYKQTELNRAYNYLNTFKGDRNEYQEQRERLLYNIRYALTDKPEHETLDFHFSWFIDGGQYGADWKFYSEQTIKGHTNHPPNKNPNSSDSIDFNCWQAMKHLFSCFVRVEYRLPHTQMMKVLNELTKAEKTQLDKLLTKKVRDCYEKF